MSRNSVFCLVLASITPTRVKSFSLASGIWSTQRPAAAATRSDSSAATPATAEPAAVPQSTGEPSPSFWVTSPRRSRPLRPTPTTPPTSALPRLRLPRHLRSTRLCLIPHRRPNSLTHSHSRTQKRTPPSSRAEVCCHRRSRGRDPHHPLLSRRHAPSHLHALLFPQDVRAAIPLGSWL